MIGWLKFAALLLQWVNSIVAAAERAGIKADTVRQVLGAQHAQLNKRLSEDRTIVDRVERADTGELLDALGSADDTAQRKPGDA